jgi:hypothetical protein
MERGQGVICDLPWSRVERIGGNGVIIASKARHRLRVLWAAGTQLAR